MTAGAGRREAAPGVEVSDLYGVSPVQAGILFHTLAARRPGTYVVQYTCEIRGALDPSRLRVAWARAFERHDVLRTAFVWEGLDDPLQAVRPGVELPWSEADWRDLSDAEREGRLEALLAEDRARGFDLDLAPLARLSLVRTGSSSWRFLWTFHHIILDGWSAVTLLREVFQDAGAPGAEPSRPRPFRAFIDWLASRDEAASREAWIRRLEGAEAPTRIAPLDFERAQGAPDGRGSHRISLGEESTSALEAFARRHRLTLATVVHGAWALTLSRYAREENVIYGTTVAGRPPDLPGVESMIGLFLNTLPVRVRVGSEAELVPWLSDLQQELVEIRVHEHTPLPSIGAWTGIGTGRGAFESLLVFESSPAGAESVVGDSGVTLRDVRYLDQSDYPLAILALPGPAFQLEAVYDRARFDEHTVEGLLNGIASALRAFADGGARVLEDLPPPGPAARRRLLDLGRGDPLPGEPRDVIERFHEHARREPAAPALVAGGRTWSYGELAGRVRRTARRFRREGVVPGSRVAIPADRSPATVRAMLGVLEAGGAYVPIASDEPCHRRRALLADAGSELWLARDPEAVRDLPAGIRALPLEGEDARGRDEEGASPLPSPDGPATGGLAYVLFTSGSTGRPKGVAVTRANLAYSTAARDAVYARPPKRFLLVSPLTFDSSVVGLYWPLATGGALVLPEPGEERDPKALAERIRRDRVTHTLCIPALWQLVLDAADPAALSGLDAVIVAGEACPLDLAARHRSLLPNVEFYNEYGPTEATVWASAFRVPDGFDGAALPIGRPIPGSRIHLMGAPGRLSPEGATGEICVAGPGVAEGYVGQDNPTVTPFLDDPFPGREGSRAYRTGDLGRWSRDGQLLFAGRIDRQVKVGGRRIEPGEIEAALRRRPAVRDAVVVGERGGAAGTTSDGSGTVRRLIAYVAPELPGELDPVHLRSELGNELPDYMLPVIVPLAEIPRGRNGKVDFESLPEPEHPSPAGETALFDPLEVQLTLIWERVLGTAPVRLDDDFFDLGGHSLLAVRLVNEVERELGRNLPLATFLERTTVRTLTEAMRDDGWTAPDGPVVAMHGDGEGLPVFLVHSYEGHVFLYAELARGLAPKHPVYGLQAPGLDGHRPTPARVERLAEMHLAEIRRVQPEGPYTIVAMCFGVAPAVELTGHLRDEGEEVDLVLLDSVLDGHEAMHPVRPDDPPHRRLARRARNRARLVRERLRRLGRARVPGRYGRREDRMRLALIEAWDAYRPRALKGSIRLVRSEANAEDPDRDWQVESLASLTGAEIDVHVVPGVDHFSLLRPPSVQRVAELIRGEVRSPSSRASP